LVRLRVIFFTSESYKGRLFKSKYLKLMIFARSLLLVESVSSFRTFFLSLKLIFHDGIIGTGITKLNVAYDRKPIIYNLDYEKKIVLKLCSFPISRVLVVRLYAFYLTLTTRHYYTTYIIVLRIKFSKYNRTLFFYPRS